MNNEPVGYYYAKACFDIRDCSEQMKRNGIPLYTHPVKELTLDELKELFAQSNIQTEFSHSIVDFARAILRKAQEK